MKKGQARWAKLPLTAKEIRAVRLRLQLEHRPRDLALFNPGIDSKLRGCDLVTLRVRDVAQGGRVCAPETRHPDAALKLRQTRSNAHG